MKTLIFIFLIIFAPKSFSSESVKASQVINHLRTIGYNGQGFEKLPDKLYFDGWSFKKISDVYYDVSGPRGINNRRYEYVMDKNGVKEITMSGDVTVVSLYKRDACKEVYEASLHLKAEEAMQEALDEIVKKYKIKDPKTPKQKWYARNYAKNCKEIFNLNQETAIKNFLKKTNGSR